MLKNIRESWNNLEKEIKKDYIVFGSFLASISVMSTITCIKAKNDKIKDEKAPKTVVILNDDNALLVDITKYERTSDIIDYPRSTWTLYTVNGETLNVKDNEFSSVYLFKGDNSSEEAEEYAKSLVDDISYYDESKKLTLKKTNNN